MILLDGAFAGGKSFQFPERFIFLTALDPVVNSCTSRMVPYLVGHFGTQNEVSIEVKGGMLAGWLALRFRGMSTAAA